MHIIFMILKLQEHLQNIHRFEFLSGIVVVAAVKKKTRFPPTLAFKLQTN